jgi:N4-gp56 family major capsid protein
MAETALPTNSRVIRWERDFTKEYIRTNRFSKFMGGDDSAPIQVNEDLTKNVGETIDFELVNRLVSAGITGTSTLEGNEEQMALRNFRVTVDRTRHAVVHDRLHEQFSAIDLVSAKKSILMDWFKENVRDRIITALGSISTDGSTHQAYASANATDRNTWLVNNSDRVVFGASGAQTVHATGITALDTTNDIANDANIKLVKDAAKAATPKIRPIKVNDEEEWYVWFMGTKVFRQVQTTLSTINQNAWTRTDGGSNPLFTGGDIIYDGIIFKEVPEIGLLSGTPGAGGTTSVAPTYLVGSQAIAYAVAQRSKMIENIRDYGAKKGAGVEMIDAIKKIYYGSGASDTTTPKQNGVVTAYFAVV